MNEDEYISTELREHLERHPYYKTNATTLLSAVVAPDRRTPVSKTHISHSNDHKGGLDDALYTIQKKAGLMTLSQASSHSNKSNGKSNNGIVVPTYIRGSNLPTASVVS